MQDLIAGYVCNSVLCPSEGMRRGEKNFLWGKFPTYLISARRVSTTRVVVTGPHIPHLPVALAIIVCALPANMLLFVMDACMYAFTYGHMHTFGLFLLICSFHVEHRISVYALTHTHTAALRQVPASPGSRR